MVLTFFIWLKMNVGLIWFCMKVVHCGHMIAQRSIYPQKYLLKDTLQFGKFWHWIVCYSVKCLKKGKWEQVIHYPSTYWSIIWLGWLEHSWWHHKSPVQSLFCPVAKVCCASLGSLEVHNSVVHWCWRFQLEIHWERKGTKCLASVLTS